MPACFQRNQQLGENDLLIEIRDGAGQLVDPVEISFDIRDFETKKIVSSLSGIGKKKSLGIYYAEIRIPAFIPVGEYIIEWKIKMTTDPLWTLVSKRFGIIAITHRACAPGV